MSETTEYQQVAAIVCSDIDILAEVAKLNQWTVDDFRGLITRLKDKKDLLVMDAKVREMRYNSILAVHNTGKK